MLPVREQNGSDGSDAAGRLEGMVTLLLDSAHLEVALSGAERALAFRKENIRVDRSAIAKVQLTEDPWHWLRGVAHPGTYVRGVIAMGTWESTGAKDFAIVRRRRAGVVIDLDGHPDFQRLVLTTRHGIELVQALRLDAEDEPADVVTLAATGAIPTASADDAATT